MSSESSALKQQRLLLSVGSTQLDIAVVTRQGRHAPVLFLHGFGSTKEDYIDFVHDPSFHDYGFIAYDAPGCGATVCEELDKISVPFLVDTAEAVLNALGIDKFHLQGHSMGGLTALLLATRHPSRVLSFINIKGNLAPEDCFLSRQIISHGGADDFFESFIERTRLSPEYSSAFFAASLPYKVRKNAVRGIFTSMVELSDHGDLLTKFLSLPCPRMYMYGSQYAHLSYLGQLASSGVDLAEIPHCGHFPMYSNPAEMWRRIAVILQNSQHLRAKDGDLE